MYCSFAEMKTTNIEGGMGRSWLISEQKHSNWQIKCGLQSNRQIILKIIHIVYIHFLYILAKIKNPINCDCTKTQNRHTIILNNNSTILITLNTYNAYNTYNNCTILDCMNVAFWKLEAIIVRISAFVIVGSFILDFCFFVFSCFFRIVN